MLKLKEYYALATDHWKCLACGTAVGFILGLAIL
jgi:ElaB/YqjD/DUF883 family membrane-anchored ribosome-binding protein